MFRSSRTILSVALALGLLNACSPPPPPPPPDITVTADRKSMPADGVNTATITVSRPDGVPVNLRASKGTFTETQKNSIDFQNGQGTATLVGCDSLVKESCAGTSSLSASSEDGASGSAVVTLVPLEICGNFKDDDKNGKQDCADEVCASKACAMSADAGVYRGTCNPTTKLCQCGTGDAGVTTEDCTDGVDNDCDGLIDCAEPSCGNKHCSMATAGAGGVCTAGTCQATTEDCKNGYDDDGDGKADCNDTDCQPVGNLLGKACDALGNTCSNPDSTNTSTCNICSGNGKNPQPVETSCGDGADNDCSGKIDCQDDKCDALPCTGTGKVCDKTLHTCVCKSAEATGEVSCADGADNDCDGLIDCIDPDCQATAIAPGKACSSTGKICNASGQCVCSGNGGQAEAFEGATPNQATCGDGRDNDCDGLIDCLDIDCRAPAAGQFGKDCSSGNASGLKCDYNSTCVCPGGQTVEASCGDGLDNDCDGKPDCLDPDCLSALCSTTGRKCASSAVNGCQCPGGASETNCMDGIDNNCDGLTDCQDGNCQGSPTGQQCNAISTNYVCTGSGTAALCKDSSSNYSVTLTGPVGTLPADGVATTVLTASLKNLGSAYPGRTVTFSVSPVGAGTVTPASAVTDGQGNAATTYKAPTTNGTAIITATYDTTGTGVNVIGPKSIILPRLGQIKLVSQQYQVMGVLSSGYQETNLLTFQVLDTSNAPYPPGLAVNFTHTSVGGSYIGSVPNCTSTTCTAIVPTDPTGFVAVLLHSGRVATLLSVQADALAGGGAGNASASNIAVVGAKANGLGVRLDCSPKNIPAFANNDCSTSFTNANITCSAVFADRFGNQLGVPTTATFSSEAGAAGAPVQTVNGVATGSVAVYGYPLPADVAPFAGEYGETYTTVCGTQTHNPRDGLVTIIVSANGEEGFVDGSNGKPANGQYDFGEYFVDQGEPFVDANDNGTRDPPTLDGGYTERYVDVNNNGIWDKPNTVWDQNTVVWADTRVIYTGHAAVNNTGASPNVTEHISRFYRPTVTTPPAPSTPPARFSVKLGSTPDGLTVYFADQNFNLPSSLVDYSLGTVSGTQTASFTTAPDRRDQLGMSYIRPFCDSGGTCGSTCNSSPCYIIGTVSQFSYGNYGTVSIGPGGSLSTNGEVRATATLNLVQVPVSIFGDVTP